MSNCPIAHKVSEAVLERSQRGIAKYGTNMMRGDLSFLDWLQHLQEELLDAAVYVERLKLEASKKDN